MINVPERGEPRFASKVKVILVLPVPLAKPLARCSQAVLVMAD
jgi:hypothetical protein